ncbi:hybrid sensor histidine kinase/response regulator [Halobellus ruber]|uniref:histidine kinase n=1 Tax=Halobellus ruber TaxID=2761102 RepID=A0A7J9SIB8_9EURY|nr:PAS domain S-box protein [Halobellus ruber]MBB6646700.1 PAS domain S-box protein [Halobellus ruber]
MAYLDSGRITVIHADDEPDFAELTSIRLEKELDDCELLTATSAQDALTMIDETTDCVVSDLNMPGTNGLELLDQVREEYPDLPFILFTGKGSEEVASEAISRGVTDYIQKQPGSEVYTLLANRIENAVEAYRAEQAATATRERYETLIEQASDIVFVVDPNGTFRYLSPAVERVLGYEPAELTDEVGFEYIHPDDRAAAAEEFASVAEEPGGVVSTEFRTLHSDGSWVPLEVRGRNLLENPHVEGIVVVGRDISDRKQRERELELIETLVQRSEDALVVFDPDDGAVQCFDDTACELSGRSEETLRGTPVTDLLAGFPDSAAWDEHVAALRSADNSLYEDELVRTDGPNVPVEINATIGSIGGTEYVITTARESEPAERDVQTLQRRVDRLDELVSVISHDLRNPLEVASGNVELAREQRDSERLDAAADALDRSQALIDDLLDLAGEYQRDNEFQRVSLAETAEECWRTIDAPDATLLIETDRTVRADASRLNRILENLLRNAVTHGPDGVTVTVGELDDRAGFYVEDDGPGIPVEKRADVFDAGYSTRPDGPGLGLTIVRTVADVHGWDVSVTDGREGGARFEVDGVEFVADG